MHLNPTAGCQISTLIFGFVGGTLCISHAKLPKDGKVLCHSEFKSKVLPGPLIDLSAYVVYCTSSRQQFVKDQLLIFGFGGTLCIYHEKLPKDGKVLCHLGFKSKVLLGPFTDFSDLVRWCTSSPQQGVKFQLWYLDMGGPYTYPMKNYRRTAKFFANWGLDQRYCENL